MRPVRVLVTRPAADAQQWVEQLQAQGLAAIALPLIEIGACEQPAAQLALRQARHNSTQPGHYRALMFVSGNAVRYFFAPQAAGSTPLAPSTRAWSPGPGTTRALQAAGIAAAQIDSPAVDAAQFDSEALWPEVRSQIQPSDRVLIVRGSQNTDMATAQVRENGQGREWLAEQLREAGALIDYLAVYERRPPGLTPAARAIAQTAANDGTLWLFSSSEAIANLQQLLPGADWRQARALATHPRIAAAARNAGFDLVIECRPSLSDVVASIESSHEL